MGWWGYGPLDGDGPDDQRMTMSEILGGPPDPENEETVWAAYKRGVISTKEQLDIVMAGFPAFSVPLDSQEARTEERRVSFDWRVHAWQVLAVMVMEGGGPLSLIRPQVLKAIDGDVCAMHNPKRNWEMHLLRRLVECYEDGKPVMVTEPIETHDSLEKTGTTIVYGPEEREHHAGSLELLLDALQDSIAVIERYLQKWTMKDQREALEHLLAILRKFAKLQTYRYKFDKPRYTFLKLTDEECTELGLALKDCISRGESLDCDAELSRSLQHLFLPFAKLVDFALDGKTVWSAGVVDFNEQPFVDVDRIEFALLPQFELKPGVTPDKASASYLGVTPVNAHRNLSWFDLLQATSLIADRVSEAYEISRYTEIFNSKFYVKDFRISPENPHTIIVDVVYG